MTMHKECVTASADPESLLEKTILESPTMVTPAKARMHPPI